MAKLINCSMCGALFLQTKWDMCDSCYEKHVTLVQNIINYVNKSNSEQVHLSEVLRHFKLSTKEFEPILSSGKLVSLGPKLVFNCARCNKPATTKNSFSFLCQECSTKIKNTVGEPRKLTKIINS